jgi:hypothetical protein
LRLADSLARLGHHQRQRSLAPFRVGHADDGHFGHITTVDQLAMKTKLRC